MVSAPKIEAYVRSKSNEQKETQLRLLLPATTPSKLLPSVSTAAAAAAARDQDDVTWIAKSSRARLYFDADVRNRGENNGSPPRC